MNPKHISVETITAQVGRWDIDIAAGWETGLLGQQRIAGKLYDRYPPEHFREPQNTSRLMDWLTGRDAALRYRNRVLKREVHFVGKINDQEIVVMRKGWGVRRKDVVEQLVNKGCFGDVLVFYFQGGELDRIFKCGI